MYANKLLSSPATPLNTLSASPVPRVRQRIFRFARVRPLGPFIFQGQATNMVTFYMTSHTIQKIFLFLYRKTRLGSNWTLTGWKMRTAWEIGIKFGVTQFLLKKNKFTKFYQIWDRMVFRVVELTSTLTT